MRRKTPGYLFRYSLLLLILLTTPIADALTPATVSYVIPVTGDSVLAPLCPAGTAFDPEKYPQNTPQSNPMVFTCYWDGKGRVYISGERSYVTGIYADDGYTVTIQPSGATFDAPVHSGVQHPVVELTSGMRPGKNTFTLVVQNWNGLSMWYGEFSPNSIHQVPYIIQVKDASAQDNNRIQPETIMDEGSPGTWYQITPRAEWPARNSHTSVVMPDGTLVVMGGGIRGGTLHNDTWQSTDQGATWTLLNASSGWPARTAHSSAVLPDGTIILMGGDTGTELVNDVWQSTDGGATWTMMNASTGWTPRAHLALAVTSDSSIIAAGGTFVGGLSSFKDVWRSTDRGATWTQVSTNPGWSERYGHTLVTLRDDSILLISGYTLNIGHWNDVWRSTDKGASWTQVTANAGWLGRIHHTSAVMPDNRIILMGGRHHDTYLNDTWQSTDNGATWTLLNESAGWPARTAHSSAVLPDGSIVLIGGYADSITFNDIWRLQPDRSTLSPGSDAITVIKEVYPSSIKQGTDAKITITVHNRGPAPVHDVTIVDSTLPEFPVTEGVTHYAVPWIEPNETRVLFYNVHAMKSGSFRLNKTKVTYMERDGNYSVAYSDNKNVDVTASLIPSTPEAEVNAFLEDIFARYNAFDRYLESMIAADFGSK